MFGYILRLFPFLLPNWYKQLSEIGNLVSLDNKTQLVRNLG